jgi:hypothetical protein
MKIITPKKPSDLFIKAGIFGVFFLIVLIFFLIASKNVKSVDTGSKILNGVTRYKGFSEKEKDALRLRNAGFWQYASDISATISVSDRIELKTNGIFWQVTQYAIGLPSGNSTRFMHVITGYLNPFCKLAENNRDSILCDVHTINQTFIMGHDTCYGASNSDTTWNVTANGKRFELGNRAYAAYDTAGGALFRFFPSGVLDIIDKPRSRKAYVVGDKTVYVAKNEAKTPSAGNSSQTFDFRQCPESSTFESFVRKAVISDMGAIKVDALTVDAVQKIVDAYYRIFIEAIATGARRTVPGESKVVKIEFDVLSNGKPSGARVDGSAPDNKKLEPALLAEVNSWVFPSVKQSAPALHVRREFWF